MDTTPSSGSAKDRQGSVIGVASSGATIAKNRYDPYGVPDPLNQGRFAYTGQTVLPELGLYYYKACIYSPHLGKFLQTDPIGYEDQMKLYAYVANDPVNLVDPSREQRRRSPNGRSVAQQLRYDEWVRLRRRYSEANPDAKFIEPMSTSTWTPSRRELRQFSREVSRVEGIRKDISRLEKGIRSQERNIREHREKIENFKRNPTTRPGMEGRSQQEIARQQQRRIEHWEKEIATFQRNIEKARERIEELRGKFYD